MKNKKDQSRRRFVQTATTSAIGFTIVPRHVLGGKGFISPSDQITVANVGCGTQGLRELPEMLENPMLRVTSVCDPNKFSTDYLDWSPHGIRNGIRRTLGDPEWGAQYSGIPGGRDIGKEYVDKYYEKSNPGSVNNGCASYEDFRDLLENEKDLDVIKIMTPDHLHAPIAIAAMKKGIHVITHKPIANRMSEAKKTIQMAKDSGVVTHLLAWRDILEYKLIKQWIDEGLIGNLKEIHKL